MARQTSPSLNESMKLIVANMLNSIQPTDIFYGTVTGVGPLQITIDQKLVLPESFLILSNMVKDHYVDLTVSFATENDAFLNPTHTHEYVDTPLPPMPPSKTMPTTDFNTTHKHEIKHKIKVKQHYALKKGEKVILLRMQGGQKYLVLDRVNTPPVEGEWL